MSSISPVESITHMQQTVNAVSVFDGFVLSANEYAMPAIWPDISREIDSLAEHKVVELILRITWGNGQPDAMLPLTNEDFAEVTGLSERSVTNGLDRAIEHGYIERQIEHYQEDGRTRKICYYGLKLCEAQTQDLLVQEEYTQDLPVYEEVAFTEESACEANWSEDANLATSSKEFELPTHSNNDGNIFRIHSKEDANIIESLPPGLSPQDNATLCSRIESLSRALGDHEHIASNIGQARRILGSYAAQGGNFEAFLLLLYEARDAARMKTKIRAANRMPYFFSCLKRACMPERMAVG